MVKCVACIKPVRAGITCPQCNSRSHYECLGIPNGSAVASTWRCGECQTRVPKGRDLSTPVRISHEAFGAHGTVPAAPRAPSASPPALQPRRARSEERMILDETAHNITAEFSEMELQLQMRPHREEIMAEFGKMQDSIFTELKSFKEEMRSMWTEMREFRQEMAEFRASAAGLSARMDGLEQRLEAAEERQAAAAAVPARHDTAIADLQTTISLLKQELNDKDQESLLSDLEIGQLPEERGENIIHTITVLAAKLGVPLEDRDVVFAERVGSMQGAGPAGEAPRARRLVVRLARRELRDRLLQSARVRRSLTAEDAGRATSGPRIFVNERLTRLNRQLFYRAREECRRLQWRFSWTRRGRVYVRQADGKDAYPIRSEADVRRVFKLDSV